MESSSYKIKKLFIFQENELLSPSWKEKKTKKNKKNNNPKKSFYTPKCKNFQSPKNQNFLYFSKKVKNKFF